MAAAADRLAGDVLERVSPELVLVDAALAEEVRRRMGAPDIERMDIEPRLSAQVDEGGLEPTEDEANAFEGDDPLPLPAAAMDVGHPDLGIDDLIVMPEDDLRDVPATLLLVPNEDVTQRAAEPEETVAELAPDDDDVIVVPTDGRTQPQGTHQSYPARPSPSNDADEEDATDAVLRLIRDHIGRETPPKRRRRLLPRLTRRG